MPYGQGPLGTLPWGPDQVAQAAVTPGVALKPSPSPRYEGLLSRLLNNPPILPSYSRVHAAPLWSNSNTSGAALSVTVAPTGIGDLMVVSVLNQGGTQVASLSGGGCPSSGPGAWTRVGTPWTDPEATPSILEFWFGTVTTTGSQSLSVTFAAAVGAHFNEVTAQDFRCSFPGTWTAEGITNQTNASSGTVTYPAVTTAGAPDIYCGYASTPSAISTSSPMAGFTAGLTNGNDCFILSTTYAGGGVQPTHGVSLSEATWAIGATFYMVPAVLPPPPFQAAVGLTTGAGTSRTATVSVPTAAGDTLLALVTTQATACTISALTDSKGNIYTLDGSFVSAVPLTYFYRSPGATGGPTGGPTVALTTSDTLTATSAAQTGNVEIQLTDVPGVGALDQLSAVATGTSAAIAVSATPTANGETCVVLASNLNAGGAPAVNPPFSTIATYQTGVNPFNSSAYETLPGSGSGVAQSYNATITSTTWRAIMYTFLPPSGVTTWALAGTASNTSSASGAFLPADIGGGTASTTSSASGAITSGPAGGILLTNSFEGNTSGTALTQGSGGNTGGGADSYLDIINLGASGAVIADSTHAAHGTNGCKITTVASSLCFVEWTAQLTGQAVPKLWFRVYVYLTANPASNLPIGRLLTSGASQCARLVISTAGLVLFNDAGNTTQLTSTGHVNLNGWTRIEGFVTASATVGQLEFKLFTTSLDATTPDETQSSAATLNTGASIGQLQFGVTSIAQANATLWVDDIGASSTAYLGPVGGGATTWTAAGTASNTSAASGDTTLLIPTAGTASNTSAASGTITELIPVAGTAVSVSSASGTITELIPSAGTAANVSAASGSVTLLAKIAGTASSVSTASGALTLLATIAGTAPTTSSASGTITLLAKLAGTASTTSTASGAFLPAAIAGTAVTTSSASGALTLQAAIAGTAVSASTATGAFLPASIAGTAANVSTASGSITSAPGPATWSVAGTSANTSTASGTIALVPAVVAGTASTVSTASGAFLPALVAGTAVTTSAASGALNLIGVLAGTASTVSVASVSLVLTIPLAGTASTVSAASGTLRLTLALAGTASSSSSAIGAFVPAQISSAAITTSSATGSLTIVAGAVTWSVAGTSVSTSTATGAFLPAFVAGTAVTVSVASGTLTQQIPITGTASTVSAATGAFLPATLAGTASTVSTATGAIATTTQRILNGTAANVSTASGTITLLATIAGTASNVSSASGGLVSTLAIAGSAVTVSVASGALAPKVAFAGTAVNTSVAVGVLFERLAIAGTAATTSLATGNLSGRIPLAGSAINVSVATGVIVSLELAVLPDHIGCTVTLLAYSGTVSIGMIGVAIRVQTVSIDHIVVTNLGISVEV